MSEPNKNGVTDRRAASLKRDSDVSATEWPIITQAAYLDIHRKAGEFSPTMRTLCLARNRIGQALLAVDNALMQHASSRTKEDQHRRIYNKLVKYRKDLEKMQVGFPLIIK